MSYWSRIRHDPVKAEKYREQQRILKRAQRARKREQVVLKPQLSEAEKRARRAASSKSRRQGQQLSDRLKVFSHYGLFCCRCGENDPMVLTIDHTAQDGSKHKPGNRKRRLSGYALYRWLVKSDFPVGYRTACANCQIRFYHEHKHHSG